MQEQNQQPGEGNGNYSSGCICARPRCLINLWFQPGP